MMLRSWMALSYGVFFMALGVKHAGDVSYLESAGMFGLGNAALYYFVKGR